MHTYSDIETKFKNELNSIRSNPYALRRTIAYWPYFYSLSTLLNSLNPVVVEEDNLFITKLKRDMTTCYPIGLPHQISLNSPDEV